MRSLNAATQEESQCILYANYESGKPTAAQVSELLAENIRAARDTGEATRFAATRA
jgi:hypothetical protein